jgi:hypothetical protein
VIHPPGACNGNIREIFNAQKAAPRRMERRNSASKAGACESFHKSSLRLPDTLRILRGTVRNMAVILSLSLPILALSACGPRITGANIDVVNEQRGTLEKVGKGISPKEVESILGQPNKSETTRLPLETQKKEVDVARYYYEQDGQTMVLHFVDNKLINQAEWSGAAAQKGLNK